LTNEHDISNTSDLPDSLVLFLQAIFQFFDNEESTGAGRQTKSAITTATQVTCS